MPDIDLPIILSFACPTSYLQIAQQNLYHSFRTLLDRNYWLNGYIHSNAAGLAGSYRMGSKFLSRCAAPSFGVKHMNDKRERIEFQDLSSHIKYKAKTYSELVSENMPNRYLSPDLLVPDRATENPTVKHALRAKVSFVKDGVFVVLSTSHALMDATSLSAIFGEWAAVARGEEPALLLHSPVWGPSRFCPSELSREQIAPEESKVSDIREEKSELATTYVSLKAEKELWHMMGLDYRPKEASSAILSQSVPSQSTTRRVFRIGSKALAQLKADCSINDEKGKYNKDGGWVSTNDALSALLWRCIVRTRIATASELRTRTSSLMYAMDMRHSPVVAPRVADRTGMANKRLANIVLYSINRAQVPVLVESTSLSNTAHAIRTAIQKYSKPPIVARALQLSRAIPDVSTLGLVYPTWMEHDVVISCLSHLPLYSITWGEIFGEKANGVPDIVRWPEGVFKGITFIMPRRRDGSVEIILTMRTSDMEKLEEDVEWKHYVDEENSVE